VTSVRSPLGATFQAFGAFSQRPSRRPSAEVPERCAIATPALRATASAAAPPIIVRLLTRSSVMLLPTNATAVVYMCTHSTNEVKT